MITMQEILEFSQEAGASDIHISAGECPTLRVNGEIRRLKTEPLTPEMAQKLVYEIMPDSAKKEFEVNWDVDFAIPFGDKRFRVNAFFKNDVPSSSKAVAAVLRTIPTEILTLEQLNSPQIFYDLTNNKNGLVLVTGPTGSGKSTTMAAMIDYINSTKKEHILTLEDPIEFVHKSKKCIVSQREIFRDTKSFGNALKGALREDPDIILVGELRDLETIRLALSAAETGHLVFGTLHTNSATKAVDRLIDVFPAEEKSLIRAMLSESLRGVVAQQLLKSASGGRVAVHEILLTTGAASNLIREGKTAQLKSVLQTGRSFGMSDWANSIKILLEDGKITREVASDFMDSISGPKQK